MMEKESVAKEIKQLEDEIEETKEFISRLEKEGRTRYAESFERDIKGLLLRIRRLNREELSGLTKDETGYAEDAESCYSCNEFLESEPVHLSRCRLLEDRDNGVRPDSRCDLWKAIEEG